MGPGARLALLALLALGGDPAAATGREDTFSALTSVARALAPERRLLGTLRRYLRGEEARLRDLTRFYDKVLSLHRIAALTGLDIQPPYAEYLQVVNYGIGGHYEPHFDHATSPSSPLYRMKSGNRVATFMIYLSSVEAGGATAFIYGNFSVPVVKNAALFWWNLLQPARKEVVHLRPLIALYHDFVSDEEAQKIRELAEPWLQRSVVASGEKQLQVEYRISKSAWLKDTVDPMLVTLDHRIAALTGLDIQPPYAEYLLAFTLIKRLQSDWRNVVHSLEATENIRALKDGYEKVEQDLPAFEDLEGAARALMRLQDVYMLNVKGLARGVFQRVTGSSITDLYSPRQLFSLTADDCFQVGKVAYDTGVSDPEASIPIPSGDIM